jgi:hypothetical protein
VWSDDTEEGRAWAYGYCIYMGAIMRLLGILSAMAATACYLCSKLLSMMERGDSTEALGISFYSSKLAYS